MSGSEPRIFPGVVSRKQRRESIRKNSVTESDEHALMMLRRSADNKSSTGFDTKVDETDAEKSDGEMEEAGGDE